MAQRNFKHVPFFLTWHSLTILSLHCHAHCIMHFADAPTLAFINKFFSIFFFFCGISLKSFDLWYHRERIHSAVDYIYDCIVNDIAIWMIYKMTYNLNYQYILCWGGFFLVIKHGDWYCCMHFLKDRFQFEYFLFFLFFFYLLYIILCCSFYILIYISRSYFEKSNIYTLVFFSYLNPCCMTYNVWYECNHFVI